MHYWAVVPVRAIGNMGWCEQVKQKQQFLMEVHLVECNRVCIVATTRYAAPQSAEDKALYDFNILRGIIETAGQSSAIREGCRQHILRTCSRVLMLLKLFSSHTDIATLPQHCSASLRTATMQDNNTTMQAKGVCFHPQLFVALAVTAYLV